MCIQRQLAVDNDAEVACWIDDCHFGRQQRHVSDSDLVQLLWLMLSQHDLSLGWVQTQSAGSRWYWQCAQWGGPSDHLRELTGNECFLFQRYWCVDSTANTFFKTTKSSRVLILRPIFTPSAQRKIDGHFSQKQHLVSGSFEVAKITPN